MIILFTKEIRNPNLKKKHDSYYFSIWEDILGMKSLFSTGNLRNPYSYLGGSFSVIFQGVFFPYNQCSHLLSTRLAMKYQPPIPGKSNFCQTLLGGGLKYLFFPSLFGEMIQFDEHIFQMGWFNHQLVCLFGTKLAFVSLVIFYGFDPMG